MGHKITPLQSGPTKKIGRGRNGLFFFFWPEQDARTKRAQVIHGQVMPRTTPGGRYLRKKKRVIDCSVTARRRPVQAAPTIFWNRPRDALSVLFLSAFTKAIPPARAPRVSWGIQSDFSRQRGNRPLPCNFVRIVRTVGARRRARKNCFSRLWRITTRFRRGIRGRPTRRRLWWGRAKTDDHLVAACTNTRVFCVLKSASGSWKGEKVSASCLGFGETRAFGPAVNPPRFALNAVDESGLVRAN